MFAIGVVFYDNCMLLELDQLLGWKAVLSKAKFFSSSSLISEVQKGE